MFAVVKPTESPADLTPDPDPDPPRPPQPEAEENPSVNSQYDQR